MVSLLCNPLATAEQLASSPSQVDGVPAHLETSLRWAGCALIQSAGILLQLPQKTIATSTILFQRFYLLSSFRSFALLDTVHAALYLSSKLTEHPIKPRDIINVTTYLLSASSPSPISPPPAKCTVTCTPPPSLEKYYVPESAYYVHRTRLLDAETSILKSCGFQTHISLPYTLCINYLQSLSTLDLEVVLRAFGYLTDALLSPSLLYLTHQPNAMAAAAAYLASRECGVKLPGGWWEVFDVEREELGFLVVGMKGVGEFVEGQMKEWRRRSEGIPWGLGELEVQLGSWKVLEEESMET